MLKTFLHNQCPGCHTDFRIAFVVDSCETRLPATAVLQDRFDNLDAEAFKAEMGRIFDLAPVADVESDDNADAVRYAVAELTDTGTDLAAPGADATVETVVDVVEASTDTGTEEQNIVDLQSTELEGGAVLVEVAKGGKKAPK